MYNDKWIIINGTNTKRWGLRVLRLPHISMAEEKIIEYTIPGRSEPLIERTGEFLPQILEAEFYYRGQNPNSVIRHISEAREVIFSNMPDFKFDCIVSDKIEMPRRIVDVYVFSVYFRCQPLKREAEETVYESSDSITFRNIGDSICYPRIDILREKENYYINIGSLFYDGTLTKITLFFEGESSGIISVYGQDNTLNSAQFYNSIATGYDRYDKRVDIRVEDISENAYCELYFLGSMFPYNFNYEFYGNKTTNSDIKLNIFSNITSEITIKNLLKNNLTGDIIINTEFGIVYQDEKIQTKEMSGDFPTVWPGYKCTILSSYGPIRVYPNFRWR